VIVACARRGVGALCHHDRVSAVDRTHPIAVFDSGVGGLTVLHECLVWLPHEDFVYLGDTARFPYGKRDQDELREFALELADLLLADGAKLLVVACNSATAAALPQLRDALAGRVGVVAVVEPESRLAAKATKSGRVGLLATPATVTSEAYERALAQAAPDATLIPVGCPELAPMIQDGEDIDQRLVDAVEGYCEPLREADVDTVILGCTHYPLVKPILQRALGRGVTIVSSGQAIADAVHEKLVAEEIENDASRRGRYSFLCTGDPEAFAAIGTRFLQMPLGDVRRVDVRDPKQEAA
jgi:glutamate racemase